MNRRVEVVKAGAPLEITKGTIPDAPSKGLIIKIKNTGLCLTDVFIWRDKIPIGGTQVLGMKDVAAGFFEYPIVLGHEICGEVHSLGDDNQDFPELKVGDRVVVMAFHGCQQCGDCATGDTTLCWQSMQHVTGFCTDGGLQDYVQVADRRWVVSVPDDLPSEVACMLPCSGLTAYSAVQKAQPAIEHAFKARGQATILIIGMGGLGMWALSLAKAMLPSNSNIVCASTSDEKLRKAKEMGASATVNWDPNGDEAEIMKKTKEACKGGLDAAMDFASSGNTLGRTFQLANKGAMLVQAGVGGEVVPLPVSLVPLKCVTISGVYTGTIQQLQELISFVAEKKVQPPPIQKFKLSDTEKALQLLGDGKIIGRAVVEHEA